MEKGNIKMKKRILVTMVALMTSIVAIGCSSNTQQQEPKETTSNEKQLEEVSVVLDSVSKCNPRVYVCC